MNDVEALAERLHEAYQWQYDECDHGTYTGGARHGEPYRMCRIIAQRIWPSIAERIAEGRWS